MFEIMSAAERLGRAIAAVGLIEARLAAHRGTGMSAAEVEALRAYAQDVLCRDLATEKAGATGRSLVGPADSKGARS